MLTRGGSCQGASSGTEAAPAGQDSWFHPQPCRGLLWSSEERGSFQVVTQFCLWRGQLLSRSTASVFFFFFGWMLSQSLATGATERFPQVGNEEQRVRRRPGSDSGAWKGQVEEKEDRKGEVQVVGAVALLWRLEKKNRRGRGGEEEERDDKENGIGRIDSLLYLSCFTPVQPVF